MRDAGGQSARSVRRPAPGVAEEEDDEQESKSHRGACRPRRPDRMKPRGTADRRRALRARASRRAGARLALALAHDGYRPCDRSPAEM
eukprot:13742905-Heterocapsa_arctica.AAC.1